MGAPLRVLFAGMEWDYGDPSRGPSFEQRNLYDTWVHMDGISTRSFDFVAAFQRGGHDEVRSGLHSAITEFDPDLVAFVLFEEEVPSDLLAELRDAPRPITFNWFCDDHWRFEGFTSRYAPLFNAVSTTDAASLPKYRALGIDPILTQWACNPRLYHRVDGPSIPGVTFVGQAYGERPWLVRRLERAGVPVEAFGPKWPAGRIEFDEMVSTFARSEISLNLTAASNDPSVPRLLRGLINRIHPPALRWVRRGLDQIKGRTFEIPACGGFQLSGAVADIETYLEPDREIVLFHSPAEMVDRAQKYLRDTSERRDIADAGYRRVTAEHTYEHRFGEILRHLDLQP